MAKSKRKKVESIRNLVSELPKRDVAEKMKIKKDGTTYCLDGANSQAVENTHNIRRLTPIETERLQGFPDNWTEGCSDTQRYKQTGNAVSVPVVKSIMEKLYCLKEQNIQAKNQRDVAVVKIIL